MDRNGSNRRRLFLYSEIIMKKILLLLIAITITPLLYAQEFDEEAVKRKISEIAATVGSIECDFVQTKELKMLNDKMISYGKMYYEQGNKLRWEYTSPYTYTFILNNSTVLISKNERDDLIDVNQNSIFKEIVRIMMSCVTGEGLTNERDFIVSISDAGSEWIADMTPQRKEMKKLFKRIILHFNKSEEMVSSVELIENNGDDTLIELKDTKKNSPIDAAIFTID